MKNYPHRLTIGAHRGNTLCMQEMSDQLVVQAKGGSLINCRCRKHVSCEPKCLPIDCNPLVTVRTQNWLGWSCTRTVVLPLRRDDGCERRQHSCMHRRDRPPGSLAPLPSRLGLSETAVDQPNLGFLHVCLGFPNYWMVMYEGRLRRLHSHCSPAFWTLHIRHCPALTS